MLDKNPIIKKRTEPFKELQSLAAPYAGNCAPDHEKLDVQGNCNCDCDCRCNCDCYETEDCDCDCLQSFCDCNCVCDCGALEDGVLYIQPGAKKIFASTYCERKEIRKVVLPEGLEEIGDSAFKGCTALEEIHFPESLKEIGSYAFDECKNLRSIVLPNTNLKIHQRAFCLCGIREITIPDAITELPYEPFYASDITTVHIGKGLSKWGGGEFNKCSKLHTITVDEENPYFKVVRGVLYSKDGKTLYFYPPAREGKTFTVPDGVETIGKSAFYYNRGLEKVYLPDGFTTIERDAFCYAALSEISLPKSIRLFKEAAFGFCQNLTRVNFRGKKKDCRFKIDGSWVFPVNKYGERATFSTEDAAWGI